MTEMQILRFGKKAEQIWCVAKGWVDRRNMCCGEFDQNSRFAPLLSDTRESDCTHKVFTPRPNTFRSCLHWSGTHRCVCIEMSAPQMRTNLPPHPDPGIRRVEQDDKFPLGGIELPGEGSTSNGRRAPHRAALPV